jgi:hypothetical protein
MVKRSYLPSVEHNGDVACLADYSGPARTFAYLREFKEPGHTAVLRYNRTMASSAASSTVQIRCKGVLLCAMNVFEVLNTMLCLRWR